MTDDAQVHETAEARDLAALEKRLAALKVLADRGDRPNDKPFGRWLGDFLDQEPDHGLLPAELDLLVGCRNGTDVNKQRDDLRFRELTGDGRADYAASLRKRPLKERKKFLRQKVKDYKVRAKFLRFMILGGDTFAPLHEAGIQLWNAAIIAGELDLRSGKCVSRVALSNCIIDDGLQLQDATLDVLVLSGSRVGKIQANGASVSGAMWLDGYFISESEVDLSGIEIGGLLDCSYGYFCHGITAPGSVIKGDLYLSNVTSMACVSFFNSDIGGSLIGSGARLTASDPKGAALDFSRAKIRGDVEFAGAHMAAADGSEKNKDPKALNAQNIKVDGSVTFGGGFSANGEVCFNGADVSKALDFSVAIFRNQTGYAIRAERAKIAGAFKFNPVGEAQDRYPFESYGCVSLVASMWRTELRRRTL